MLPLNKLGPARYAEEAFCVKYCHWTAVVLHQFIREIVYLLILGPIYQVKWALTCRRRPVKKFGTVPGCKKRVCFVRHGQGDHNASLRGWQLCDPPLNAVGEKQVADLHTELKSQLHLFDLIAVSPLTRAMQTATGGFEGLLSSALVYHLSAHVGSAALTWLPVR